MSKIGPKPKEEAFSISDPGTEPLSGTLMHPGAFAMPQRAGPAVVGKQQAGADLF